MNKKVSALKLYRHYLSIILKSAMQYKASFWMLFIGQFWVAFCVFLGICFMFQRFSQVKGYAFNEVLLCYALVLAEFSLAEIWARGFDTFPSMIRQGTFDRVLLRPRSLVLQVLGSKFEYSRLGKFLQASVIFVYGVGHAGVRWTALKIVAVFFMLVGGTALFAAMFLIYAGLSFFTLEGLEFINVFTDGAKEYGKYPLDIYGKRMLLFTTAAIPYALVQYYPFLYLIDRSENAAVVFLPLLAFWILLPAYGLWRYGVKKYQSSGS